jgi:predicted ATPase
VVPFIADFVFDDTQPTLLLRWRERNSDAEFGAHQASDGTLRLLALLVLLVQPPAWMPDVLILDEPELGLHPAAIRVVAGLVRNLSADKQIILATQSTVLLDECDPEDVVVVERVGRESRFRRLDAAELAVWMEEYSLGELWDKNVLGGRP